MNSRCQMCVSIIETKQQIYIMEKKHDMTAAEAQQKYPGVETDNADNDKVDPKLVKEETKELNNNPRNNDIDN